MTRTLVKSRATNHGIAVAVRSFATAILVSWWRLVARWKGHDPRRRFGRSAADRTDNIVADMAALVSTFESASRFEGADKS